MTGIYLHVPFCHSKCIYCDFYSIADRRLLAEYARGVIREYVARKDELSEPIRTIYLGGGTPSILPIDLLSEIVSHLPLNEVEEFTIEVNPEDVTTENVTMWRELGINRISMGVQSLDDDMLKWMRRRHTATDALTAIETIRAGGINNISCDLIYGLPGLSAESWRKDLTRLLSMPINHLSAYCLTYSRGTALYHQWEQGKVIPAEDDLIASQFAILRDETARAGFEHYEISNFARPGFKSRHNSLYWSPQGKWLGLGPAAHSFDGSVRRIDIANTRKWLEMLPEPYEIDEEDELNRINDLTMTGLRTAQGLDLAIFDDGTRSKIEQDAQPFLETGKMHRNGGVLTINRDYWLVSDSIIRELMQI